MTVAPCTKGVPTRDAKKEPADAVLWLLVLTSLILSEFSTLPKVVPLCSSSFFSFFSFCSFSCCFYLEKQ
mgnify:CR=1 FL=1